MSALTLDHLAKRFDDVVALDEVSLVVGDHEVVALARLVEGT